MGNKSKMTDKHKMMAYILSTDLDLNSNKNITQSEIGKLFGVSQPTIAQAIKEAKFRVQIQNQEKELSMLKKEITQLKGIDALQLPEKIDSKYKQKP